MSRQGRMHGSPCHVETSRYKYAVEHEVEPYPFSKQRPNCTYYINTNHSCSLWNSGFSQCNSHKCPYLQDGLRRHGTCLECAFFYNEVCYNNHKPTKTTVSEAEAAFCCFFICEAHNRQQFRYIRSACERYYFTCVAKNLEKQIQSKNKYISQAKKELQSKKLHEADVDFLTEKIAGKQAERQQLLIDLKSCNDKIASVGGRVENLPWMK